jgi:hypothetical protein
VSRRLIIRGTVHDLSAVGLLDANGYLGAQFLEVFCGERLLRFMLHQSSP